MYYKCRFSSVISVALESVLWNVNSALLLLNPTLHNAVRTFEFFDFRYRSKNSEEYSLIQKMTQFKTSAKCGVSLNNNVSQEHY